MMNITDPNNKSGVNSGAREGQAVPASYKTPAVLLVTHIYSRVW
jgi:hypothetical protein